MRAPRRACAQLHDPGQVADADVRAVVRDRERAHAGGDRARRSVQHLLGVRVREAEREHRGECAREVEHRERQVAPAVLEVAADQPQEQHVADQVQPAAVDERRGERIDQARVRRMERVVREEVLELLGAERRHVDLHDHADRDHADRERRQPPHRLVTAERDQDEHAPIVLWRARRQGIDRMHRGALACEQVLDRAEHEALALEHVLAGERGRHHADRVVAATTCDLDLRIGKLADDRSADRSSTEPAKSVG